MNPQSDDDQEESPEKKNVFNQAVLQAAVELQRELVQEQEAANGAKTVSTELKESSEDSIEIAAPEDSKEEEKSDASAPVLANNEINGEASDVEIKDAKDISAELEEVTVDSAEIFATKDSKEEESIDIPAPVLTGSEINVEASDVAIKDAKEVSTELDEVAEESIDISATQEETSDITAPVLTGSEINVEGSDVAIKDAKDVSTELEEVAEESIGISATQEETSDITAPVLTGSEINGEASDIAIKDTKEDSTELDEVSVGSIEISAPEDNKEEEKSDVSAPLLKSDEINGEAPDDDIKADKTLDSVIVIDGGKKDGTVTQVVETVDKNPAASEEKSTFSAFLSSDEKTFKSPAGIEEEESKASTFGDFLNSKHASFQGFVPPEESPELDEPQSAFSSERPSGLIPPPEESAFLSSLAKSAESSDSLAPPVEDSNAPIEDQPFSSGAILDSSESSLQGISTQIPTEDDGVTESVRQYIQENAVEDTVERLARLKQERLERDVEERRLLAIQLDLDEKEEKEALERAQANAQFSFDVSEQAESPKSAEPVQSNLVKTGKAAARKTQQAESPKSIEPVQTNLVKTDKAAARKTEQAEVTESVEPVQPNLVKTDKATARKTEKAEVPKSVEPVQPSLVKTDKAPAANEGSKEVANEEKKGPSVRVILRRSSLLLVAAAAVVVGKRVVSSLISRGML